MKIGLVCSHGGHLTEMLELLPAFEGHDVFFVTYHSARETELGQRYRTYALDNIGTSPWKLAASMPGALGILRRERPDMLVSTGSEIALPFFFLAKVLRIGTVFVEGLFRVNTASSTGKVLYPLADAFFVQWPQLVSVYGPKARYEGGLL
jgi:beta-1,4-N-acetylglucosaminyltransferase